MTHHTVTFANLSKGPAGPCPSTTSPVARALRRKRIELGITQRQAADLTDVSEGTWRSFERGTPPTPGTRGYAAVALFRRTRYETVRNTDGSLTISWEE